MSEIKRMPVKEFREKGYLQELNRRFLHPLGLAIEIVINDDDTESFGRIWDYREDPEGLYFDIKNSSEERKQMFKQNYNFIQTEFDKRFFFRKNILGFEIEPIEED